jgi:predicted protein tyrosine phosphatase
MKEVFKDLWVGDDVDFESLAHTMAHSWSVVHAAKEPYHRELIGYTTKSAPKEHPYYLFARFGNLLFLNLVDADNPNYIPEEIIDEATDFITDRLSLGDKVLVHCNEGNSRAPSLAFIWMVENGHLPSNFHDASREFSKLYPEFKPGKGMFLAIKRHLEF